MKVSLKDVKASRNKLGGVRIVNASDVTVDGLEAHDNGGPALDVTSQHPAEPSEPKKSGRRKLWSGWVPPLAIGLVTTVLGGGVLYFLGWS